MQTRTVSVGPGATTPADSQWLALDTWAGGQISYQAVVTGTVSYAIQTTNDDPNSVWNPIPVANVTWDSNITGVSGATASTSGTFTGIPSYIKVALASGSGSVTMTVTQSSSVPF